MGFKSEKREINCQRGAFEISIALHAVIIFLVFSMNNAFICKDNLVVIDFTLENSLIETGTSEHVKSQPLREPALSNHVVDVKSRKPPVEEEKPPLEDAVAKIEPAEIQDIKPVSPGETQPHGIAFSEQSKVSEPATSVSTNYGSGGSTDRDMTKTDVKMTSGRGFGNTGDLEKVRYLKANFSYIKDMIQKRIIYPAFARRMGWEGKVNASFIVSSDGFVKGIKILKSSGFEILDKNAIEAIKGASPFPNPPVEAQIIIPIIYKLN